MSAQPSTGDTASSGTSRSLRAARRRMSSSERRQQVVSEAATLFDEVGYHGANMDDLASRVGVAKPTLYHYFQSKDQILQAIHEEFIDFLLERHDERAAAEEQEPHLLILAIMTDVLGLMETHRGHVRVFFEHHRQLPEEAKAPIRLKRVRYQRIVEDLVTAGIEHGTFRPVDPTLAMLAMFGMCNWAYQWYRPGGTLRPHHVAEHFWSFLVSGIGADPAAPPGSARHG